MGATDLAHFTERVWMVRGLSKSRQGSKEAEPAGNQEEEQDGTALLGGSPIPLALIVLFVPCWVQTELFATFSPRGMRNLISTDYPQEMQAQASLPAKLSDSYPWVVGCSLQPSSPMPALSLRKQSTASTFECQVQQGGTQSPRKGLPLSRPVLHVLCPGVLGSACFLGLQPLNSLYYTAASDR